MPRQEGDTQSQGGNTEERPAGDPGRMPGMRDQDVQNREVLEKVSSAVFRVSEP